jgi:hypothetical protein
MKLVLIHGRAQEGKKPAELQAQWEAALGTGLARAGAALPPGTRVVLPFYGDTLARLVAELDAPLAADVQAKGTESDADRSLRGEIIGEIAARAGITDADIRRELDDPATPKGPQNWEWVQATLRALDRIPGFNSSVIDLFTRDVYVYLEHRAVRKAVDAVVAEAIGDEPCVVVAHSLGTVVAYNVLGRRARTPGFPRLVTLGSPLGIRGIQRLLERPLVHPPCVGHWFNAYDDRDVVALVPLDGANFDVRPTVANKGDVNNFTENRHGIEGYLADPVVARHVAEALGG